MGTPIDRTAKTALDSNLVNGVTSDAPKVKANNDVLYNYADGLNSALDTHAAAAILPHADQSVTGPKLKDATITEPKYATGSVSSRAIANGAVGVNQLATGLGASVDVQAQFAKRGIDPTSAPYNADSSGLIDCTALLQSAIDALGSSGGKVILPVGTYLVKGTITVKENVVIEGIALSNRESIDSSVKIVHQPISANTDLFIAPSPSPQTYVGGLGLRNFNIVGSANSRYAIKLDHTANAQVDNIRIDGGFVDGIVCTNHIHSKYSNILIGNMSNAGVRFTGSASTTTVFENCYFNNSVWAFVAEAATCLGVSLNNCIFESCTQGGLDIYVDNVMTLVNPYAEDIPTGAGAKPIIQIGVNGTPHDAVYPQGYVTVIGGMLAGGNNSASVDANSSIFNVDKIGNLAVFGTTCQRAGYLIKTTSNTKLVTIVGIQEVQLTSTKGGINDTSRVMFLGYNENNTVNNYLYAPEIRFSKRNKWKVIEAFSQTDGDLIFQIGAQNPLWLDAQFNIRHNFSDSMGNVSKVDIFGDLGSTPDFTGIASTQAALWAQTVDSRVVLRTRDSSGLINTLDYFVSTTAARPTTGNRAGRAGFDTTLNKPIWRNAANSGWIDATGTSV